MSQTHTYRIAFVIAALVLAAGCAPSADNVDEIWDSTSLALSDAQTEVATDVALGTTDSADLVVEASCEDGGSITVSGSMGSASILDTVSASFDLKADFHACESEGVTIDGQLDWALSAEVNEGAAVRLEWTGDLDYSGKYVGNCVIDMFAEAAVTGTSASVSYEGTICGFDASASLSASDSGASVLAGL